MLGVCCSCQSLHPVRRRHGRMEYAEPEFYYVMDDHFFPGTNEQCEGVGTIPQAIVKDDSPSIGLDMDEVLF